MGIYDRPYYRDDSSRPGVQLAAPKTMVGKLILLNAVVFLAMVFFHLDSWLVVTADVAMRPALWWKFLTCGFAHDPTNWQHIFFNMFMLYMFGREVESVYGGPRFLQVYLFALLMGSVIWTFSTYFIVKNAGGDPQGAAMLGASGAVVSIFVLFCLNFPHRRLFIMMLFPAPAWVVGVAYVLMDISGVVSPRQNVAYLVHLVGAACGFIYFFYGTSGDRFLSRITTPLRGWVTGRRLKVYRGSDEVDRLAVDADRILEKLHRDGESSLTPRERRILESYSRQVREQRQ